MRILERGASEKEFKCRVLKYRLGVQQRPGSKKAISGDDSLQVLNV